MTYLKAHLLMSQDYSNGVWLQTLVEFHAPPAAHLPQAQTQSFLFH